MTCAEFQKVLPYIIETGGNADEEAHLRSCPICSDLVSDLKYIVEQAKLLVPMVDPPGRVWQGIETELKREGLMRPAGNAAGLAHVWFGPRQWATTARLGTIAALLVVAIALILYRNERPAPSAATAPAQVTPATAQATSPVLPAEDQKVVEAVAVRHPAARERYAKNLAKVNAYIRDAQRTVDANPDDPDARDYLRSAYDQKALIYQMAVSRSLQ